MTPQALANSYRERANGSLEDALDAACEALIAARVALEVLSGNASAGFMRLPPATAAGPAKPAPPSILHSGEVS